MADTIYGRVFDASMAGWIADVIVSTDIPDNTYLKESSLGTSFVWSGGTVDVSAITVTDPSIADLYIYVEDLSTHVHTQDSSIPDLYNYVNDLSTNTLTASSLYPYATNASVGSALGAYATNASVGLANFTNKSYVDGSLGLRDSSISWLNQNKAHKYDSATNYVAQWNSNGQLTYSNKFYSDLNGPYIKNATSSQNNAHRILSVDATERVLIIDISSYYLKISDSSDFTTNSSINSASFATNASVGLAFGAYATNASVGLALGPYATNASVGLALGEYATNSSINTAGFATNSSIGSAGFMKQLAGFTTCSSTTTYVVSSSDNAGFIQCDASLMVVFPDNLSMGFQCTVLNSGTGYVTLNASTLYTTDSSVRLIDRYSMASAVHKGSGVWFAAGNLK